MDAVSDTVDRAAKLTGQLLAFARRQALKLEVFDIGPQLGAVADMPDAVTGARIRVVTEVPDAPCFVRADLSQFETALINTAVNARDAMDGKGTLTLRLACSGTLPAIRGHAGSPGSFAAVSLTDTENGIEPNQLARIFEPFSTLKEVGKGTGLGLSQVFGFAKQSGGNVDVDSTVGQGTTFTLYLPEVEGVPCVEPAIRHQDSSFPTGDGQCVLVVENNIEVGRFATQILEDLGYRTTWAANAEEALNKLGQDGLGFDAVFSDVVMPGMGGIALAKLLQRRLPNMPVLLASGYSHVLAQDGLDGFDLLHKSYSADQRGRLLSRIVPRRPSAKPLRDGRPVRSGCALAEQGGHGPHRPHGTPTYRPCRYLEPVAYPIRPVPRGSFPRNRCFRFAEHGAAGQLADQARTVLTAPPGVAPSWPRRPLTRRIPVPPLDVPSKPMPSSQSVSVTVPSSGIANSTPTVPRAPPKAYLRLLVTNSLTISPRGMAASGST